MTILFAYSGKIDYILSKFKGFFLKMCREPCSERFIQAYSGIVVNIQPGLGILRNKSRHIQAFLRAIVPYLDISRTLCNPCLYNRALSRTFCNPCLCNRAIFRTFCNPFTTVPYSELSVTLTFTTVPYSELSVTLAYIYNRTLFRTLAYVEPEASSKAFRTCKMTRHIQVPAIVYSSTFEEIHEYSGLSPTRKNICNLIG